MPRERLAVDLVGPLARSRDGYKYLLTSICVASRYPFTVPLKDVAAESVCEALLEIWSQTGIPREVLSDQGTQFMGKVMSQLCKSLHAHQMRASPYHPQANVTLKRFHGTLTDAKEVNCRLFGLAKATKVLPFCIMQYA